ncbi:MAG: hypothetical protein MN733_19425 [Nitrososphaera sp.]|nr:hypothetical protein [Nitrososphaera sp.]
MNKWNRLLAVLDEVYGFEDKKTSTFRKVSQYYDERVNEHVVLIEYRIRRGNGVVQKQKVAIKPQQVAGRKHPVTDKLNVSDLLRDVHLLSQLKRR